LTARTVAAVPTSPERPPLIPVRILSDALAALGAYAEPPTEQALAAAAEREGTVALTVRLANALYGSALTHVMTAEVAASQDGVSNGYRSQAWRAAGATPEGTAILLHYTAMRLAADLRFIAERMPVELGVMEAAAGAAGSPQAASGDVHRAQHGRPPRGEHHDQPRPRSGPAEHRRRAVVSPVRRRPGRRSDDHGRRAEFGAPTGPTGSTVRSRKVGRRPHIPSKIMLTVVFALLTTGTPNRRDQIWCGRGDHECRLKAAV
jgi:hypothetical protein